MGIFSFLFGGKRTEAAPAQQESPALDLSAEIEPDDPSSRAADLVNDLSDSMESSSSGVGIWDFAEGKGGSNNTDVDLDAVTEAVAAASAPSRGRRNKTRLIGFETSREETVDLFEKETVADSGTAESGPFPVGWLVVIAGPGRGTQFSLHSGLAQ
ncbi:MAG: hypothetical protein AAGL98_11295, partial [Planctomycetota bacterium]